MAKGTHRHRCHEPCRQSRSDTRVDEYSSDITKIFTGGKFEQLLSTIALAREHGGWGDETVDGDTDLIPLVVVPDAGPPAEAFLAQFDLVERSRPLFAHLQPHVYPPAIMQLSDVQLLEGIADLAKNVPTLPGQERDLLKLIAGWRWAATKQGESPLQLFLMRRGFPAPLSDHILSNSRKVIQLLDGA